MASTTGGFLVGFGLCLLLISLGALTILAQYYGQITQWRDKVEWIYHITHSSEYISAMNALERLSPYVGQLADAISSMSWMPGLGWLSEFAEPLRQIGRAAQKMRDIYELSEAAYYAIQAVEVAPEYLTYGVMLGLVLIVAGAILIVKARRKRASPAVHPPS